MRVLNERTAVERSLALVLAAPCVFYRKLHWHEELAQMVSIKSRP